MGSMTAGRWWDLGHQVQTWGTAKVGPRKQSPWRGGEICCPLCPSLGRASIPVPIISTHSRPHDIKTVWGWFPGAAADRVSRLPRRWQSCIRTRYAGSPQLAPVIYWKRKPDSSAVCLALLGRERALFAVTGALSYSELNKRHCGWEASPGYAAREAQPFTETAGHWQQQLGI